jgi:signal transduction histidine kinase
VPGEVVAAAVLAVLVLPMTVIGVVDAPTEPLSSGSVTWVICLSVALHVTGFLCFRYPTAAFVTGAVLMLGLVVVTVPGVGNAAMLPSGAVFLLLVWRSAAGEDPRRSTAALVTGVAGAVLIGVVEALWNGTDRSVSVVFVAASLAVAVVAAWALGRLARQSRVAADQRRRDQTRRAVLEERVSISRDLHDVIAHSLTVMIAQAEAARVAASRGVTDGPGGGAADESLGRIAETGRDAMQSLRSMISTLGSRDPHPTADQRVPTAGIAAVGDLVGHARSTGHTIDLRETGVARRVAVEVDLAAYRVVSEAITNVVRHVHPPVRVDVALVWGEDALSVTVRDDSGQGPRDPSDPGGTGLVSLTERVERAGGTLEIRRGSRARDRGWCVQASFPYREAT